MVQNVNTCKPICKNTQKTKTAKLRFCGVQASAGSAKQVIPAWACAAALKSKISFAECKAFRRSQSMLCGAVHHIHNIILIINNKPDSKRQQTTTVDNKRLINGLVLTDVFPLRQYTIVQYHEKTKQ